MARHVIGGGKEKTFESRGVGRKILDQRGIFCGAQEIAGRHEISRFQIARDIEHGFAFAHREGLFEHLAVREFPENVVSGGGAVEEIFTGLKRAARMAARVEFECDGAADYSLPLQQARHAAAGGAMRHIHKNPFGGKGPIGLLDAIPQPGAGRCRDQKNKKYKFAHA